MVVYIDVFNCALMLRIKSTSTSNEIVFRWMPQVRCKQWFRQWIGAVRFITWTNIDQGLFCDKVASLAGIDGKHKDNITVNIIYVYIYIYIYSKCIKQPEQTCGGNNYITFRWSSIFHRLITISRFIPMLKYLVLYACTNCQYDCLWRWCVRK